MSRPAPPQPTLFALPPPKLEPAAHDVELRALGAHLPEPLHLGCMSWAYPGWQGHVYAAHHDKSKLSAAGLGAYAEHPLMRMVEIDSSYYAPLPEAQYADYAAQTPAHFRFTAKATDVCVMHRFPTRPRYGQRGGQLSRHYLDADYALEQLARPMRAGLGDKLAALLLQFPPQEHADSPWQFARRLRAFLAKLTAVVPVTVELRNRELFTRDYVDALVASGATHCHTIWPGMPPLLEQARFVPKEARKPLFVRWLMRDGDSYEEASKRYEPFDRLQSEDAENRGKLALLVGKAIRHGVSTHVLIDNKAEGCAPLSARLLAEALLPHDA